MMSTKAVKAVGRVRPVSPRIASQIKVRSELTHLKLVSRAQDTIGRAEPYMLFVFFSFDGAKIKLKVPVSIQPAEVPGLLLDPGKLLAKILDAKLEVTGTPTISNRPSVNARKDTSRSVFNGERFSKGEERPIPSVHGRWESPLLGFELAVEVSGITGPLLQQVLDLIPGLMPKVLLPAPVFGMLYVLLERDLTNRKTIAEAHEALNEEVARVLNGITAELSAGGLRLRGAQVDQDLIADRVKQKAIAAAIKGGDIGSLLNKDDLLGTKVHVFTTLDLLTASAKNFEDTFDEKDTRRRGEWRVRGRVALA